jgi:predicted MPP superfamily phosphohydrolase
MKLPHFARIRAFLGLIILAFMSIYRPRQAYEMISDACRSNEFRISKKNAEETAIPAFLNVYGQKTWGDEVVIAGTTKALIMLSEAIDKIIIDEESAKTISLKASDGEEYSILLCHSPEIERLSVPYYGDDACEGRLKTIKPGSKIS